MSSLKQFPLVISLLLVFGFCLRATQAFSQNAPVTTAAVAGNASPGVVTIPLTVTGFSNIGAISLSIDYDYAVMTFVQGIKNPLLPGNFAVADNDLGNGIHRVSMGWFGNAMALDDGSSIMDLQFNYISGVTDLVWYDNGGSCEYANGNYIPLNDIPTSDFYINGAVCGTIGTTGPVTGNNAICQGQAGEIYSITPVINATWYEWSVPEGAIIVSGQNTNVISVDYPDNASSGFVEVFAGNSCTTGPEASLQVTVNPLPNADAGIDQVIPNGTSTQLHAALGGSGSFAYHWSPEEFLINPDVREPLTEILYNTTVFTVQVTNLGSYCQNTDAMTVTITGGPLSVNPVAIPSMICQGESSQLLSNAGGGSGNYSYEWTSVPAGSPPWSSTEPNPVVTPDSSRQYILTVYDDFTTVFGTTSVTVFSRPTATISGGDSLCGNNEVTFLPIELTGAPPWNFTYSYGNNTVFVYDQYTTPFYVITGEAGIYTVNFVEDAHCEGYVSGTAEVNVFPVPDIPDITYDEMVLSSSSCCGNQWYLNYMPVPGATGQSYQVTESGLYFDIVTLNGCSSDTSEILDIIVNINDPDVKTRTILYPNPTGNYVHVIPDSNADLCTICIYSSTGNLMKVCSVTKPGEEYIINVDDLSPGVYILHISGKSADSIHKLIIMR